MAETEPASSWSRSAKPTLAERRNRINFFELAYQKLEEMLVRCELRPGRYLTMQDLQDATGFGRSASPTTPSTGSLPIQLIRIRHPAYGLQIPPIDLARERMLLRRCARDIGAPSSARRRARQPVA